MIKKILLAFFILCFAGAAVFLATQINQAPLTTPEGTAIRARGDYIVLFTQSILGIILVPLPILLERKSAIKIPAILTLSYAGFIYAAMFLGAICNFYYRFFHWDTMLHVVSGGGLVIVGYAIAELYTSGRKAPALSPVFLTLFAFSFAMMIGMFWEIFEFSLDTIIGTNTQRWADEFGLPFVGQDALFDTMKDIIANAAGGIVASIIGYISLKHGKSWLDGFYIKRP